MIKLGIVGYGNLGKAAEKVIQKTPDMELVAIFSRRKVVSLFSTPIVEYDKMLEYKDKIDVMLLCSGSATDLPKQGREVIENFNTADSFDTHALMPNYHRDMDRLAKESKHTAAIAIGWDPGLFSHTRLLFQSILGDGVTQTFWGKGVSQGHSEAVRKIDGVKYAIQYTIPKEEALDAVRTGEKTDLSTREKHLRVCYVVPCEGVDTSKITNTIINMPNYFADYDTTVNYISEQEFFENHNSMPHGGFVIRNGEANGTHHSLELSIKLESNPDFTASVLVAYSRAVARLAKKAEYGARTILDIPSYLISDKSLDELISTIL